VRIGSVGAEPCATAMFTSHNGFVWGRGVVAGTHGVAALGLGAWRIGTYMHAQAMKVRGSRVSGKLVLRV
jgi:hypothetical protein